MRRIYMDANATTPLLPEVFEAMRPFLLEHFGNASSIHQQGQHARAAVDGARAAVAQLLHVRPSEIIFTSGGTESDNLALFGALRTEPQAEDEPTPHIITSAIEHHAVLHAAEALSKRGVEVTFLPCTSSGLITPESLTAALRPNTRLVSIMFANNETGTIQPIAELARITRNHGALFHTDAVQAAGKLPLDLSPSGPLRHVDLLAISGHKMYAPQGTGILFCRRSVRLSPLFHGGTHERQRRAGTENVPGIVALGKAAELAATWLSTKTLDETLSNGSVEYLDEGLSAPSFAPFAKDGVPAEPYLLGGVEAGVPAEPHSLDGVKRGVSGQSPSALLDPFSNSDSPLALAALRDHLEQSLLSEIPESGVNGAGTQRTPNTSNLFFDHVEAEALVIALDLKGLSVSGGSACQSGATEPSHVLTAMGLSPARARASIRFSLSRLTTRDEINEALRLIPEAVARLRSLSPTWTPALILTHA